MNITREIGAIRKQAEEELGCLIARAVWDVIEGDVGSSADYSDGDPEGYEDYLESYRNVTRRWVEGLKAQSKVIKARPRTDANGDPSQPKRRYRKCFERRYYLVDFVAGRNAQSNRIDWKTTVADWNGAHPSDTMSLLVLKAEYYRALREGPLALQHLATTMVKQIQQLRESLSENDLSLTPDSRYVDISARLFGTGTRLISLYGEVHPAGEFLKDSIQRIVNTWNQFAGILPLEWLKALSQKKRELEATDERAHTEEVQRLLAGHHRHRYRAGR